jgi:hypothetical protein
MLTGGSRFIGAAVPVLPRETDNRTLQGSGPGGPWDGLKADGYYNPETFRELTQSDAICDPLIALVNRADGISGNSFAQLIESAARVFYPA